MSDLNYRFYSGKRVVLDLVKGLSKGHGITTDNFFTSFDLARDLYDLKFTLTGTVRLTRLDVPPIFRDVKGRDLFSSLFLTYDPVTMVSYKVKNNKLVTLMSSEVRGSKVFDDDKKKPEIVLAYNSTKGGVDTMDQMVGIYSCQRGTRRWTLSLFENFLDLTVLNNWILWCEVKGQCERSRFIEELSIELVTPFVKSRDIAHISNASVKSNINMILKEQGEEQVESQASVRSQGRCHLCVERVRSTFSCAKCKNNCCKTHFICICNKCQ